MGRELAKGDLPILILVVLATGPSHGYAIAREVERQSGQSLRLREGSLYPALRLLEHDGLISGQWQTPPRGPARKVYHITAGGRAELAHRAQAWQQYVTMIEGILGGSGHAQRT